MTFEVEVHSPCLTTFIPMICTGAITGAGGAGGAAGLVGSDEESLRAASGAPSGMGPDSSTGPTPSRDLSLVLTPLLTMLY